MSSSALLTKALVKQVADILKPSIEAIIALDPSRSVACVAVLDPTIPYDHQFINRDDPLLWQESFGEPDKTKWKNPYDEFALKKAHLSWRTGLPSHLVQRHQPHLLLKEDFKFGGSVCYEGIIVGTSGLAWHHDLAISGLFASTLHAFVIGAFEVDLARKPYFVGLTE
jgi:hypothetical protein